MNNVIECKDVSIIFGEAPKRALPLMQADKTRAEIQAKTGQVLGVHQCSFDVREGEILVLMGLSGSGKSTLLRAMNGLNPVLEGTVHIRHGDGWLDVATASSAEIRALRRTQVAMVFQQFGLLPWRSVAQNVGFGLEVAGIKPDEIKTRVLEKLDLVGLSDWADRNVGELSGGMQQRVGLARAFATHAPILLMDEPFSALDPLIRTKLQDDLLALQKRLGVTIVFVSHDLDEAFKLGNKIAILKEGRMVQIGTPREIFNAPCDPYVADFVQQMNPLHVLLARDVAQSYIPDTGPEIDANARMSELIKVVLNTTGPLRVMDAGGCIGSVSQKDILSHLNAS